MHSAGTRIYLLSSCHYYRSSTNSITVPTSSIAASVVASSSVNTAVSSNAPSHSAYSTPTVTDVISPSLVDDSSASSSVPAAMQVNDKPVHYPKKVRSVVSLPK